MLDFELRSSKQFGKTIFPNYFECIWLPLITFAWQLLCALFFPFAEIFAALCQAVDQQSCTEMHTHTDHLLWLDHSFARSISLVFTLCNPIKVHFNLMAFAFVQLFIFRRVTHTTQDFHWMHIVPQQTHNDTSKIINLKCALFSRHYLRSHSLDCTHNLHFTDHRKQMNWNAHIHCVCGKSLVIFFSTRLTLLHIANMCIVTAKAKMTPQL